MQTRQRTPHLIGREGPLRVLLDALTAAGPEGALVLVSGEAGIGKTRLLDEFAARAEPALAVRGGCVEGVAYAPWTDALWWLLSSRHSASVDALSDRTRSQLGRLVPRLRTGGSPHDDDGGQLTLFEAVLELLTHVAVGSKLVVVVDDLHWIDPASAELLRYLAGNLRRVPILLVVSYRPEDSAPARELIAQLGRLGRYRVELDALTDEATAEMATYLLDDDVTASDLARIVRDADGNPLFVEELVAAVSEDRVPQTLRDLMLVRFGSLDTDARHLARTAALIGSRAPREWLASAAGLDADRARIAARAAIDAGVLLVDDKEPGYAFKHDLLRESIVDDLVPDERVALHRSIAAALTDHPARAVGVDYVSELARHWDAADDAPSALRWLVAAAQRADESYAFQAAANAYERALVWWDQVPEASAVAGVDHAELLIAAAHVSGFAGHIERAADLGRAALEEASAQDPTRGLDAAGRLYPVMWTADRAGELFEFASKTLLPVLDTAEPIARARFLMNSVKHQLGRADPRETRLTAAKMLDAVSGIHDAGFEANAHAVMAHCYESWGELDRVDAEYELAASIARAAGAHATLALVRYNHASFMLSIADVPACLRTLEEVDGLVQKYGLRRYVVPACGLRVVATCLHGDMDAASAAFASIEDLFAQGYDAWFRAYTGSLLRLFTGDHDAALAMLQPGAVGVDAVTDSAFGVEIAMVTADALAWKGDVEAARTAVDSGQALLEHYYEMYCHGWLAIVAMRIEADAAVAATSAKDLDAIEHAQARAAAIVAGWQSALEEVRTEYPLLRAYSLAIDAELARLNGGDVASLARAAADAFNSISYPYYTTYFRWREAEVALEHGDRRSAIALLQRVRAAARLHGFGGLEVAASALARTYQLRLGAGGTTVDGDVPLSSRELEVLRLLIDGRNNPEIADELCISRYTARAHVSNILKKLNAASRVEAVTEAVRRGLV